MNSVRFAKRVSLWLVALFVFLANASSQDVYVVKQALAAKTGYNYGREAVYTDKLAYLLFDGQFKQPADGEQITLPGTDSVVSWQAINADSAGNLTLRVSRRDFLRGGGTYFYFTYNAGKEGVAVVDMQGASGFILNGVLHAGDPYSMGWLKIPVQLKKGKNEFLVRGFSINAKLEFPAKKIQLLKDDATLPSIVKGEDNAKLIGGIVILNSSNKQLRDLSVETAINGKVVSQYCPSVPAMGIRKIAFLMDGSAVDRIGQVECIVSLKQKGNVIDTAHVVIEAPEEGKQYRRTFISDIDGSVQYYAVTPQVGGAKPHQALFFSVHGAGVEAISQARAYQPKEWGTLVAPTNRRPRGFNWEDWGRLDALEVLSIAKEKLQPDPERIYLTGHSMGGHGTWFLGATYPDKWAAIAPCAGYPTLKGYGSADGLIPDSSTSVIGEKLLRSSNQSDVIKLVSNYQPLGVYIFHGDSDRVVPVNYARQMKKILADFHKDMSYYEYPGGSHWFGDQSVDWAPLFNFFSWHKRPQDSAVNNVNFVTFNPGVSSSFRWATIYQQQQPLNYTNVNLTRERQAKVISGTTENVRLLKLDLKEFNPGDKLQIKLDSTNALDYTVKANDSLFLKRDGKNWSVVSAPALQQKGPHRNGTLKDAFNHNMVFVYGTTGTKEENQWSYNKATYDAESWYYRGNGAVEIIADREYDLQRYKDRGVILYGNSTTNKAWKKVLNNCPIQVSRNDIIVGDKKFSGDQYGGYFVWPLSNSTTASVAVISGTGMKGMNAASANQYFAGGSGFPDYMIFTIDMLKDGVDGVKMAGFFDNHWKLATE
jgi:dienelactone hydrolase